MTWIRIALVLVFCAGRAEAASGFMDSLAGIIDRVQQARAEARAERLAGLERRAAEGGFSTQAVLDALNFLEGEPDPEFRARGAKAFYLLFYDTRDTHDEAFQLLIRLGMLARFAALSRAPEPQVRRYALQTCQIMLQSMAAGPRDEVARRYVLLLLEGLEDDVVEHRHEALAALENWADTSVLRDGWTRRWLTRRMKEDTEEDVRERIAELLKL